MLPDSKAESIDIVDDDLEILRVLKEQTCKAARFVKIETGSSSSGFCIWLKSGYVPTMVLSDYEQDDTRAGIDILAEVNGRLPGAKRYYMPTHAKDMFPTEIDKITDSYFQKGSAELFKLMMGGKG